MTNPKRAICGQYPETCGCTYLCPCIDLDITAHPANPEPALARAAAGHVHALGIDWDGASGTGNGHFAPFSWAA
jgi:hypothetical protein